MKMAVFWVVATIALMMEAARTSQTLINFYQTIRRYNPEDSHLYVNEICFPKTFATSGTSALNISGVP
jgi:hypothetical protein